MSDCEDIRGRLILYLDNELQGDERLTITSHLQICESCRRIFEEERELIEAVREARPEYVASSELRAKVTDLLENQQSSTAVKPRVVPLRQRRSNLWVRLAIAAALLVIAAPVIIWRFMGGTNVSAGQPSTFALMAAETHLRRTRGQLPLEVESASPNQISQWFSNKVNFSVKLPNYQESSGQDKLYTLEGARLVGFRDDYAAYVAYKMRAQPISLVITSDSVATPSGGEEIKASGLTFHYDAIQGLKVITWSDRGLTYALVSDLEERGQQSCIVCHQGSTDRDLIEKLKPRSR